MKQKNNNLFLYFLGFVILAGIIFVATKEFKPETTTVELELPVKK